jgi:hypothetical protein
VNTKQIQELFDRINFSLLYEDYDKCDGERILALIENSRRMLSETKISDQKV